MGSNLPTQPVSTGPASQLVPAAMLRVRSLYKGYVRGGLWRKRVPVAAVDGVDFEIARGQTLALVGESGSGKSTVARCVARLEKPDSGQIWIDGKDVAELSPRELFLLRTQVQLVFQDAFTSMNPRFSAAEVVEEPLLMQGEDRQRRSVDTRELINEVGLPPDCANRSIMEFSGGQRQRLAIARALVVRPKLLILDEALTGLDLSTQAQIVNLLLDLQARHELTYLLISHDLALVARIADTIAVMAAGRIVENGPAQQIVTVPWHEQTLRLLASACSAQNNLAAITGASA
jgi:ABC-type glutathione transport system ATPase component